jgi:Right handed beta helix region
MNDFPRQKLRDVVARHGHSVINEPRRCEGLLRDYCGAYRREIAVLMSALEERVVADLLAPGKGMPRAALLARLAQRLRDNMAMEEAAARWAVHSWALALGVVSSAEVEAIEEKQSNPALKAAPVLVGAGAKPRQVTPRSSSDPVVSATGEGDYASLSEALKAAAPGARLLVRPGLYREGLVLDRPVEIIGVGTPREIIIANANASCVLMQTDEAKVRGLTLREEAGISNGSQGFFAVDIPQGRLTLEDCDITSNSLSCIGIHNDLTDPVIRRCRIHTGADSGVYVFDAARGTVEDCDIDNNTNVGVAITGRATLIVKRCAIHGGRDAGVVAWKGGSGSVEECEIYGNAKAGVGISEGGNLSVSSCRIYDGENSGVFVHNYGQGALNDCDIYNHAEPEVAITLGGNLIMRGCIIHEGRRSGVFISDGGRVVIERCDVDGNADAGIDVDAGGGAAVRQSRVIRNGRVAIRVKEGSAVVVEGCDLTENLIAAWETEDGALVESRGNKS